MPYIDQEIREDIDPLFAEVLANIDILSKGDINYIITRIVAAKYAHGGYKHRSTGTGVFEDAKLEYVRRVVAPYEDKKIAENGDIPEYIEAELGG